MVAAILFCYRDANFLPETLRTQNRVQNKILQLGTRAGRESIFRNLVAIAATVQKVGYNQRVLALCVNLLPPIICRHLQAYDAVELVAAAINANAKSRHLGEVTLAFRSAAIAGFHDAFELGASQCRVAQEGTKAKRSPDIIEQDVIFDVVIEAQRSPS